MYNYDKPIAFLRRKYAAEPEAESFRRILAEIPIAGTPLGMAGLFGIDPDDHSYDLPPAPPAAPVAPQPFEHSVAVSLNHTTLDYANILKSGLRAIAEAAPVPDQKTAVEAVIAFAGRYAELGFEACRRVPEYPARTLAEALQSIFLIHAVTGIAEHSFASISLGRLDQYCYPYFRRDLENGVPIAELKRQLAEFIRMLNTCGDAAKALNLGGCDSAGNDLCNDLTRLLAEVLAEERLPAPLIAVRCHRNMRDEDLALFTRPELFTIGQPTFYSEENCRKTLLKRGVPESDLEYWCVNSCMGLMIGGREFSDMWALVVNVLPGLSAAITPESSGIDEIFAALLDYHRQLLPRLMEQHGALNKKALPAPFISALLTGGAPGLDRLQGGVKYHTGNVDFFALVNASDALVAIDELVFRRKTRTLAELIRAVECNFEDAEEIRLELLNCPKFGNGNAVADQMAAKLARELARIVRETNPPGHIQYMPSFHTLNTHVWRGGSYPATLDGRKAGEPFAKNVGPMQGRNRQGISGLLHSAAAIDQTDFPGGQALDIYLDRNMYDTPEALRNFRAMLRSYFDLGGLQIQVNAVSIEDLKKAIKTPELYEDLTVRIGGYSRRFNSLGYQDRLEMIERFQFNT